MTLSILRLYHQLPAPLRSLVATARGYYLRAWRYGPGSEELVLAALERERMAPARWDALRARQLGELLHRAATRVPYYREYWAQRRRAGDRTTWEDLASWPILTKEQLRSAPRAFIADDRDPRRMFHEHTSGTTGKPLSLWFARDTVRTWYALYEARVRRWAGVSHRDRWANIGGQQVVPFAQDRPPFWVWNGGLRQLYLSSYHLATKFIADYLRALRDYEVVHALGYSSSLHSIAELAREVGIECPKLVTVTSNAEPLFDYQRAAISKAFGSTVRETYGMSEIACAAGECEHGSLHVWPEVGVIEVRSDERDEPVSSGTAGRLICTGLLNHDMPLIRYEVGDRGELEAADATCACGRTLPIIRNIEGRIDDMLVTADGRRIGRLDPVFKNDLPIREAQIIQETVRRVRIKVVPAPGYTAAAGDVLAASLRERMGDIEVIIEPVDHIPRTANGKFRAVLNQIA